MKKNLTIYSNRMVEYLIEAVITVIDLGGARGTIALSSLQAQGIQGSQCSDIKMY